MQSIKTNNFTVTASGNIQSFQTSLISSTKCDNVEFVTLKLKSEKPVIPQGILLNFTFDINDIHAQWNPVIGYNRSLVPDWSKGWRSKSTSGAPVHCLYNYNGYNRLTFALSDALNAVEIKCGVNEETAVFKCSVELFVEPMSPITDYEVTLRLDTRDIPYYEAIGDVSKWWGSLSGYTPAFVPEVARLPMYSTWYSFHQHLNVPEIIEQCSIAKALGCEAVIADDGWQTDDNSRGYSYCGDWEVTKNKIPDMAKFVEAIHHLDMKFILWYSVPFVGRHSKAWTRFTGKFLSSDRNEWCTLDPRFPEVREYLISIYEKAVTEWDLDGLKLDFVDSFNLTEYSKDAFEGGRDYKSVPEAVDRLLKDALNRLRTIKNDFMIEFRQSYVGPLMRTYGNMFRASDCPNDSLGNRMRTLDIRLLCGNTAAHSDMVMWNYNEPAESAAMQLINVLFAVPQVSVLLDKIPQKHFDMVKYWLRFWKDNRDVLLDGSLSPQNPEVLYSKVFAEGNEKFIAVLYSNNFVRLKDKNFKQYIFINGSFNDTLLIEACKSINDAVLEVKDCCGNTLSHKQININAGLNTINVPAAGTVFISF